MFQKGGMRGRPGREALLRGSESAQAAGLAARLGFAQRPALLPCHQPLPLAFASSHAPPSAPTLWLPLLPAPSFEERVHLLLHLSDCTSR